jgi:hypothetical protein
MAFVSAHYEDDFFLNIFYNDCYSFEAHAELYPQKVLELMDFQTRQVRQEWQRQWCKLFILQTSIV